MKLSKVQITNYKSIWDSTEFGIDEVTCLVGKNESGKTALLQALHRLNPVEESTDKLKYDAAEEYPRSQLTNYENILESDDAEHAVVVKATFSLDDVEIDAVRNNYGQNCLLDREPVLTLSKGYDNKLRLQLSIDEGKVINHTKENFSDIDRTKEVLDYIETHGAEWLIYKEVLEKNVPKFLYFDEYYQLKGQDNLNALSRRFSEGKLENSDYPMIGLIERAGLKIDQLVNPRRTTSLLSRLESTSNVLTERVLSHWTQNKYLRMRFDVRRALPEDPPGMRQGTNIWGFIENTVHFASTELGSRSRGFVWFFSFLAWYSRKKLQEPNMILLLDEPGLSLHAKAQEDLLRYIETELKPHHQLIYTTHSPFMVDPQNIDRVRIVQDMSVENDLPELTREESGTKVLSDPHKGSKDSLFPLQGALGYEIYQNLFIGPNCLIVEGVTDLIYIRAMSSVLESNNRIGLNKDWTITPVGGITNVPTFVALIGAQGNLNLALLIDTHKGEMQKIDNLYKEKLLDQSKIHSYANFLPSAEADVEDMFEVGFYLRLINEEYSSHIQESDLNAGPRIVKRVEDLLIVDPVRLGGAPFNHYRPARYFNENISQLESSLTDRVLDRWEQVFTTLNGLLPQ